jgi:hypothetical protein
MGLMLGINPHAHDFSDVAHGSDAAREHKSGDRSTSVNGGAAAAAASGSAAGDSAVLPSVAGSKLVVAGAAAPAGGLRGLLTGDNVILAATALAAALFVVAVLTGHFPAHEGREL